MNKKVWILICIIAAALLLRVYALDRGDVISDEALYGFRAIGMLDFDFAVAQPSPLQLFTGEAPWWARLSFHDHPLLVFFIQHVSMGMAGVNLWGLRLPSVVFGLGSLMLVYGIGKRLFSERVGIVAAALMAVQVLMVYVSRVAIQESQVIFFIVLTLYWFLRARDDARFSLALGASLGLGVLSKYTAGFIVVPLLLYLIIYQRTIFRSVWVYGGALLFLIIVSPSLLYNIFLYKTFGHFDFQLFYIFGQKVSYWAVTPGKEIGSLAERVIGIPITLWQYGSWVFAIVACLGLIWTLRMLFRQAEEERRSLALLLLIICVNLLLYCAIGSSPRFITMLIPWLIILIAVMLVSFYEWRARIGLFGIIVLLAWEGAYSYQSLVAYQPWGREILAYSRIHWDVHAWGFSALDQYLDSLTRGNYPQLTIPYRYQFLETIKEQALERAQEQGLKPSRMLIVYDTSMSDLAALWTLQRRSLYQAWPIISTESYREALASEGNDFYQRSGFTDLYVIRATEAVLRVPPERQTDDARVLEEELQKQSIAPLEIRNHAGDAVFRIYHVSWNT